jgi:ceramide glucosyltransferase
MGWLFVGLAFCGSCGLVLAGLKLEGFRARPVEPLLSWPAITVLKPLRGAEPGLDEALASFLGQDYPGAVQVVFGVQDRDDPALSVVDSLRRAHPERDLVVVLDSRVHGPNGKVSNLVNMTPTARHGVLVLADSDIAVPPDYLRRVAVALAEPGVGVVTCPYFGVASGGLWARLAAMGISYQFLPNLALGVGLGLAQPCMGSTIALRRETLARIGGFEAFAGFLADDYAIGAAVRACGLRSVAAPVLVAHCCSERTLGELVAHELRWASTVRGIDPAGYLGSGVTHATPLAVIANLLLPGAPAALAVLAAALAARLWLVGRVAKISGTAPDGWWLTPVRDILSLVVFVSSFFVRAVVWRGTRFRVDRRGALTRV